MIVPVQFADVEVSICALCMSLCVLSIKQNVWFSMALQFSCLQAVPMNAVLRIGNKALCESLALDFGRVYLFAWRCIALSAKEMRSIST